MLKKSRIASAVSRTRVTFIFFLSGTQHVYEEDFFHNWLGKNYVKVHFHCFYLGQSDQ